MRKEKGITLVALVVTVVVLIIIASIGIGILTGDSGIVEKSNTASRDSEEREEENVIRTAEAQAAALNNSGIVTEGNLITALDKNIGQGKYTLTPNEDGTVFEIVFLEGKYHAVHYVYTENIDEVSLETVQVAQAQVEEKVEALIEQDKKSKMPVINGVLIAVTPVQGSVTSRFGVVSSIRSGAHTGTDICCPIGTQIKAVASGTVTFAQMNGSYGNLIKVSHGNGVETWYAHCKELYATVGQQVNAGDVIAAVGMTGNTTGPHLHLEIRVNGTAINPQNYLYK